MSSPSLLMRHDGYGAIDGNWPSVPRVWGRWMWGDRSSVEDLSGLLNVWGCCPHMLMILFPQTTSCDKQKSLHFTDFINGCSTANMFNVLPKVPLFNTHSLTHLTNIYEWLLCASRVRPKIKVQCSANSLWSTQECLEWLDSKCLSPPCFWR